MNTEKVLPTRGQLERQLSQTLQSMYRKQFGHLPSKISCHIFADKVAIVAENTATSVEKILFQNFRLDLARNIRLAMSQAFTEQVKAVITDILQVRVVDTIADSTSDGNYLGMIVFLEGYPKVRLPKKRSFRNNNSSVITQ
ncbi:MAG: DUF2294 domain-containing protein [Cyanobacteria bacterium J06621_8]